MAPARTGAGSADRAPADERLVSAWERRHRDPLGALTTAETLRDEAVAAGDQLGQARALTIAGACHLLRNDHPAALRALSEAAALLADGPAIDRARALSELGYLEALLGDAADAIERLSEALALQQASDDPRGAAATWNRIGVVHFGRGDLDDAEDAYRRSLELRAGLERPDDVMATAGVHNNLAKVATARSAHDRALEHLAAARAGFEQVGEVRGSAMVLHNAAVVHADRGEHERAVGLLRESIARYAEVEHPYGACEARTRLARLLAARGAGDEARVLLERAHADAHELGLDDECARASAALADLLELHGEVALALGWLRHVRAVERRLFDEASDRRLRSLQVRFQLEQLERDSVTDALTGLLNRRGLDRVLEERAAEARREGRELSVILLDLDDFKAINDVHSHSVGDEVLRRIATLLREGTRPTDVCARLGGEEFVVVLPNCPVGRAEQIAAALGRSVRDHAWGQVAAGLAVTTSAGVAALDQVSDLRSLLAAADRSLYAAKRAGKDRVGPTR